ncbi:hypothetical protein [Phreatobacter sp.]|uniref:hypothetical protein n=1 Tax=Phreatobacter sp. TaxID=1966341 RepID=UPI0022C161D2|nr:hypothetical protein [Phreatobacter sp.]MCZ8317125.1 hypothetical protein [Phreatobacter sp.]
MSVVTQDRPAPLPFEAMERLYEDLADAVDRAGPAQEAVFLTKLVMVMAHRAGDTLDFESCLAAALGNLSCDAAPDPAAC